MIQSTKPVTVFELLSNKKSFLKLERISVGVAGFEPAASCSQSRRDNRATLHPESVRKYITNSE